MNNNPQNIVIGGGFYGCRIAIYLKKYLQEDSIILEAGPDILKRASYHNQARVHNGYHYPRSILTAIRSRYNFPKFIEEYEECISSNFLKLYGIAKFNSKVNAKQFYNFYNRIGAPIKVAERKTKSLFSNKYIEEVFVTEEFAFDAAKLAEHLKRDLAELNIPVITNVKINSINSLDTKSFEIEISQQDEVQTLSTDRVFNCTYANLNQILELSGYNKIKIKNELTEMSLTEVPEELRETGITVMDGAFFSLMPFPDKELHTLSHVRYTPHFSWQDDTTQIDNDKLLHDYHRKTNFYMMRKDAERFVPAIGKCSYKDSLWEIKTVLSKSENNDSRPILMQKALNNNNFYSVLGGKIDNIYDVEVELKALNNE